jgi:hypothetical protein
MGNEVATYSTFLGQRIVKFQPKQIVAEEK